MSMAAADGKKKKEGKVATCRYCDMTFRKLEHAQRHERTHTLDRPYSCDTCGKTFARQDTLHRHSRLHVREEEEGPTGKAPRKRRISNASAAKPAVNKADSESSPELQSSGSSSSPSQHSMPVDLAVPPAASSSVSTASLFPGMGLSMSLPVAPPSFPAYSQPEHHAFPSIDPSFIPLSRRFSDASYPTTLAAASLGTSAPSASSSAFTGAAAHDLLVRPERPALRPRAMTLAGLPESLGCFSLVNSPISSHASLDEEDEDSLSDSDDDGDQATGDSDIKVQSSATSSDNETAASAALDACSPSWAASFPPPESHYPSPAFSAYSPTQLHTDPLEDLQSILENDPVGPSSRYHVPSPPPTAQPDFDYASFAASIEGPDPSSRKTQSNIPVTLEELLGPVDGTGKVHASQSDVNRYPTPPSGSLGDHLTLPLATDTFSALGSVENAASFNLAAHLHDMMAAESEQLARADRAATLAMFTNGFGVSSINGSGTHASSSSSRFSPRASTASSLSALGLAFGPPPAQIQAQAHAQTQAQAKQPANQSHPRPTMASSPSLGSSSAAMSAAYALSATFATTYPTLSLPVAGFDRLTSSALKYDSPSLPELELSLPSATSPGILSAGGEPMTGKQPASSTTSPMAANSGASSESCIDLLARAWEKRSHRTDSLSAVAGTAPSASWPPVSPFALPVASSAAAAKSTPAFYIPASPSMSASPSSSSAAHRGPW